MTYEDFLAEWNNDADSIKAATSGSTGTPKTIYLPKSFVRDSALRTISFFNIGSGHRLHSCVSPDFIGGKMMGVRSVIAGCRLTWEIPSNRPLQTLSTDETIDLLAVVPSQMEHIIGHMKDMPGINNVIVGGAPIPATLRKKIAQSGINAYETYGMTETASHIALRKITNEEIPFKTLEGISVSLNEEGCLTIEFSEGEKFQTNDLAELVSTTEFFITGRSDNIINTGGKKVNPISVESRLHEFIPETFIITSRPDEKWGERIVMVIEGEPSQERAGEIIAQCREILQPWECPKEVIFMGKIPRTSNGKICRDRSLYHF